MRTILCLVATAMALALAGCAGDVAHLSATDGDPTRLAPQESNGLRAEATLHQTPSASGHALVLDLRLVNTASVTRRNISVSRVTLGNFANDARPAASANLYGRGSSIDYPAIGSWQLPANVSTQQQLDVEVRYEIQAQPSVAHFRWTIDAGASLGGYTHRPRRISLSRAARSPKLGPAFTGADVPVSRRLPTHHFQACRWCPRDNA